MCVASGVIAYQYRRRWLSRAILIGGAGAVVAAVVTPMWPWRFARAIEPDPGAWAHDTIRTIAVLDPNTNISEAYSLRRERIPKKQVAARIDLVGAPPEYGVGSVGVRARLSFPDGRTIESAQRESAAVMRSFMDRPSNRITRLQAVLGDVRLLPDAGETHELLPVVIRVADADYQRYGEQPGRLTATVDFSLTKLQTLGSLPLSTGAVVRNAWLRCALTATHRCADVAAAIASRLSCRVAQYEPPRGDRRRATDGAAD
jgi:hypothetical protein